MSWPCLSTASPLLLVTTLLTLLIQLSLAAPVPAIVRREADFESVRTRLGHSFQNPEPKKPTKYFHEAKFDGHYDGRFASTRLANENDRHDRLVSLVQTYISTMQDIGAETWIMHGTLMGWWWNREIMPWDSDVDVMVPETSMDHLADYYNMTVHHFKLPGVADGRDYLLEVNPNCRNGSVDDDQNRIDARWIDTDSGLFIDITTLRHNKTAEAEGISGAMMVKDTHHYMYDDIFPLRDSSFENLPVKVPFAYAELLREEYGAASLTRTEFEKHRFDEEKNEWIPMSAAEWIAKHRGSNRKPGKPRPATKRPP